ncbi:hypothetical protein ZWY2020_014808 [Hordeum vulgare]|nr:hypothetical protein ZWY2020_014808 [Hordeum vulgare]
MHHGHRSRVDTAAAGRPWRRQDRRHADPRRALRLSRVVELVELPPTWLTDDVARSRWTRRPLTSPLSRPRPAERHLRATPTATHRGPTSATVDGGLAAASARCLVSACRHRLMCSQTEHHAALCTTPRRHGLPSHLMPEEPAEVNMPTAASFLRPSYEGDAAEAAQADADGVALNTFLEPEPGCG